MLPSANNGTRTRLLPEPNNEQIESRAKTKGNYNASDENINGTAREPIHGGNRNADKQNDKKQQLLNDQQYDHLFDNLRDIRKLGSARDDESGKPFADDHGIIEKLFTIDMVLAVALAPVVILSVFAPKVITAFMIMPYILLVIPYIIGSILAGLRLAALFGSKTWSKLVQAALRNNK